MKAAIRNVVLFVLVVGVLTLSWMIFSRIQAKKNAPVKAKTALPAPVQVADISRGAIDQVRMFSGALESRGIFVVAPEVDGRLSTLSADLGDTISRGQEVARINDAEFIQAISQAEAELAMAKAAVTESQSARAIADSECIIAGYAIAITEHDLAIADREQAIAEHEQTLAAGELKRISELRQRGIASDAQYDAAQSKSLSAEAAALTAKAKKAKAETAKLQAEAAKVKAEAGKATVAARIAVAEAQVTKVETAVATAKIQMGYTRIRADWSGEDKTRVVAERLVNEGEAVSANQPLLRIVQLDPLAAVIHITEGDFAKLHSGQEAILSTDAYPGEQFHAKIDRIAPEFGRETRQARIELTVRNEDFRLKPGMFVRVKVVLSHVEDAVIVPNQALASRNEASGLFLVNEDGKTVSWTPVKVGIMEGERVQILEPAVSGRVVTLGQQLIEDGSAIAIPKAAVQSP